MTILLSFTIRKFTSRESLESSFSKSHGASSKLFKRATAFNLSFALRRIKYLLYFSSASATADSPSLFLSRKQSGNLRLISRIRSRNPDSGGNHLSRESLTLACLLESNSRNSVIQPGSQRSHFGLRGKAKPSRILSRSISRSSRSLTYLHTSLPGNIMRNFSSNSWGKK